MCKHLLKKTCYARVVDKVVEACYEGIDKGNTSLSMLVLLLSNQPTSAPEKRVVVRTLNSIA